MNDWFEWNGTKCTEFGINVTELPPNNTFETINRAEGNVLGSPHRYRESVGGVSRFTGIH